MHELQSLLLQKLPRLGELTFGCEVKTYGVKGVATIVKKHEDNYTIIWYDNHVVGTSRREASDFEILGHPFSHSDILEALGEDWAMTGGYQLVKSEKGDEWHWWYFDEDVRFTYPKLPKNLSDLSLPEWEETRKQLIQLLTK